MPGENNQASETIEQLKEEIKNGLILQSGVNGVVEEDEVDVKEKLPEEPLAESKDKFGQSIFDQALAAEKELGITEEDRNRILQEILINGSAKINCSVKFGTVELRFVIRTSRAGERALLQNYLDAVLEVSHTWRNDTLAEHLRLGQVAIHLTEFQGKPVPGEAELWSLRHSVDGKSTQLTTIPEDTIMFVSKMNAGVLDVIDTKIHALLFYQNKILLDPEVLAELVKNS